ncbi:MAG: TIGR04076 family protein [Deltaproteobacteria bacterium]|nr:TIGR04076 family protein [Deltaproteobacteria bacterium]
MSIRDVAWNIIKWKFMKKRLGYTDEKMKKFRENPRNEDVLSKAPELLKKTIIVEIVDAHGCNSQHGVGDKFYFDGAGNLLTKLCPKRVCVYALNAITPQIFTANELFHAGVDPNEMRFKRAACFDVGLECGGWGRVVMEIRVEDHKKA